MAKPRTYQEIEALADFYSPGIYELLPRFSNLKAEVDPLAGDYVPLTSVGVRTAKDAKMFIVGILPPTSNVTGRLLDRSASIAALTGVSDKDIGLKATPASAPSPDFYDDLVATANRLGVKPEDLCTVLNGESRLDPSGRLIIGKTDAKGLNGMIESTAKSNKVGMPKEVWDNYQNLSGSEQLPWVERSMRPCAGKGAVELYKQNLGGYNNPQGETGTIGQVIWVSYSWVGNHSIPKDQYPNLDYQNTAYSQNKALDYDGDGCISDNDMAIHVEKAAAGVNQQLIDDAKKRVGNSKDTNFEADALSGQKLKDSWDGKGSANASKAQKQQAKLSNTDMNYSELGRAMLEKQLAMIKATLKALEVMKNTPPLRMLVNPSSFKVASEKIVSDGNRSRSQPIIEHWGEQQDKIDASGKIAGFYAADMVGNSNAPYASVQSVGPGGVGDSSNPYPTTVGTYPGLTRNARQFSASWQNFLSLYMLYRSNGGLFLTDFYEAAQSKDPDNFQDTILSVVGSVYIYYDNILYIGSFDTFTITETDSAPFTAEYSFTFTVRASFLLDSVADPRFTYGAPRLFDSNMAIPTTSSQSTTDQFIAQQDIENERLRKEAEIQKQKDDAQAAEAARQAELNRYDPMRGLDGEVMNNPDPWNAPTAGKNPAIKKR